MGNYTQQEKKKMFLFALTRTEKTMEDAMEDWEVSSEELGRWWDEDEQFQERIEQIMRGMDRRKLELKHAAAASASVLVRAAPEPITTPITKRKRKACVDLVRLEKMKEEKRQERQGPNARPLVPLEAMRESRQAMDDLRSEREKTDRLAEEKARRLPPISGR